MGRSKWKGPFIGVKTLNKIKLLENKSLIDEKLVISRSSEIVPAFVGLMFYVHDGKSYSDITVNENMVGYKFGEFTFTRAKFVFKKKKLKK